MGKRNAIDLQPYIKYTDEPNKKKKKPEDIAVVGTAIVGISKVA